MSFTSSVHIADEQKRAILLLAKANQRGQPLELVLGVIETESNFDARAFRMDRNGGSYGLMQLDAMTARDRGWRGSDPAELFDPARNIILGVAQLTWIEDYLRRNGRAGERMKIAAYNEGVGAAMRGIPDLDYVNKVIEARDRWAQLLTRGVSW